MDTPQDDYKPPTQSNLQDSVPSMVGENTPLDTPSTPSPSPVLPTTQDEAASLVKAALSDEIPTSDTSFKLTANNIVHGKESKTDPNVDEPKKIPVSTLTPTSEQGYDKVLKQAHIDYKASLGYGKKENLYLSDILKNLEFERLDMLAKSIQSPQEFTDAFLKKPHGKLNRILTLKLMMLPKTPVGHSLR